MTQRVVRFESKAKSLPGLDLKGIDNLHLGKDKESIRKCPVKNVITAAQGFEAKYAGDFTSGKKRRVDRVSSIQTPVPQA